MQIGLIKVIKQFQGGIRRSYLVALGVVLLAAIWVASGQFSSSAPERSQSQNPAGDATVKPAARARVAHLIASNITHKIIVHGETQPSRAVEVKAEVRGPVEQVFMMRGASFVAGSPLFRIADNGRTAQLEKAKAALALRQAEFEAVQSLAQTGFNSRIRLAEARSNLMSAQAELELRQIEADNLVIRAPFDGILNDRLVEEGEFVEVGQAVAQAVQLNPITVVGDVSESSVSEIDVGMTAMVELLDGRRFPATLIFKSSTSNSATRTFEIELAAENPEGKIAGGLTATIQLAAGTRKGHLISPSVLTLADDGLIGVKTIDAQNRVRFMPVTILEEGPEGTWVGGLPDEVDLVTIGQDFLSENEEVVPVYEDPSGS